MYEARIQRVEKNSLKESMIMRRIFIIFTLLLTCAGVFSHHFPENDIRTFTTCNRSLWRDKIVLNDDFSREGYSDTKYEYDQNGNMTSKLLKGIASVTYNLLNLPDVITFTDGSTASYCYDMTGEKRRLTYSTVSSSMEQPVAASLQSGDGTLAQTESVSGSVTTTIDYHGSQVFQNYDLKYIRLEDDGIWTVPDGYCYYVKDHLGNVRSVNNLTGGSVQTSQYYPFGKMWDDLIWGSGSTQPFRYGGKELDRMHGLDCYDYGARMYDPGIGRFMSIDPKAEDYYDTSPYAYCLNNPIKNTDPDGRSVWSRGAKLLWHVGKAVAKNGLKALNTVETYTSAFSDIQESVNTLTDANASTADKVMAGVSLASEFAPVSVGDAKAIKNTISASRRGNNVKGTTKSVRFVTDSNGNTVDTYNTPSGNYIQPNGDRTDILQTKSHFNKKEKRNDGFSHTHPKETNIDRKGVAHTTISDNTHQPTYDEIKNIENGKAQKVH